MSRSPLIPRTLTVFMFVLLAIPMLSAQAQAEILRNDGFESGFLVVFQGGFVAGESAASRLGPPAISGPHDLDEVHFLFGGALTQQTVTLNIYDDVGTSAPGPLLYTGDYLVTGSETAFTSIDLSTQNVTVDGFFWVSLQFQHTGYPSVGRDNDGIRSSRNYIFAQGIGWIESSLLGLTGDWVIRATATPQATYTVGGTVAGLSGSLTLRNNGANDLVVSGDGPFTFPGVFGDGAPYSVSVLSEPAGQDCVVANATGVIAGADVTDVAVTCLDESTVLDNDGWAPGQSLFYQAGFVAGEIAAARLSPGGPGTRAIQSVIFIFGGAPTTHTVRLHIWDDTGGTTDPGTELYAADYLLTGADALQAIDLSTQNIQVTGDFRVGLEFNHAGLPSVSRDGDGIVADRNFIYLSGGPWSEASAVGLTGDWVIRAVDAPVGISSFAISAVADLPNDQGRQVRVSWDAAGADAPGSPTPVTGYALFRRIDGIKLDAASGALPADALAYPPGAWDFVKTVPAFQEASYATIVPTVADSTIVAGMHWSVFFVRAMTAAPGTFFDTPPDSGYSVDNLVPQTPQNFVVVYAVAGNDLTWAESADADFQYFKIYRGAAPGFPIDPQNPWQTTVEPQWTDPSGDLDSHYRITAVDHAGNESDAADPDQISGVDVGLPARRALAQNYPNPFNPSTSISFSLAEAADVRLRVFDSRGSLIRELLAGVRPAGENIVTWDGRDRLDRPVGSGVYFYRLQVPGQPDFTRRMVLAK